MDVAGTSTTELTVRVRESGVTPARRRASKRIIGATGPGEGRLDVHTPAAERPVFTIDDETYTWRGQQQRIAIARALYHRPPILVFDEATSSLDTESERAVKQSLDELLADRTSFVIAHRLSTIRDAGRILVLERGRLVEQGTHDELMQRQGLYFFLASQQLEL
jgi:hypothetical protein